MPLGQTRSGNTEMCEVEIFGQSYSFMITEKTHHPFNDAISFAINCDDQIEIDTYWNYLFMKEKRINVADVLINLDFVGK